MLSPRSLDRSGEGTEYVSGCAVERQKRAAQRAASAARILPQQVGYRMPAVKNLGFHLKVWDARSSSGPTDSSLPRALVGELYSFSGSTDSLGPLSSRRPRKTGWRNFWSAVHS